VNRFVANTAALIEVAVAMAVLPENTQAIARDGDLVNCRERAPAREPLPIGLVDRHVSFLTHIAGGDNMEKCPVWPSIRIHDSGVS
jgi:hypothetical protein